MESPPRIDRARPSVFITALLALCCCCWIDGHQEEEHCSTLTRREDETSKKELLFLLLYLNVFFFLVKENIFLFVLSILFFLFFIRHTRNNRERKRAMTIACTLSVKKKLEECGDLFICQKKKSRRHWWCFAFIMSLPLLSFSIALHAPTPSLDSLCVDSALSYIPSKFLERSYWSRSRVKIYKKLGDSYRMVISLHLRSCGPRNILKSIFTSDNVVTWLAISKKFCKKSDILFRFESDERCLHHHVRRALHIE
jgi:hypothetical protein